MQSSLQFYRLPILQLADSQILVGAESLEALAWAMSQWNVHKRIMMKQELRRRAHSAFLPLYRKHYPL
jgi:hypothetical protein